MLAYEEMNWLMKQQRPHWIKDHYIITLPHSEFKPFVKRFSRGKWYDFWATQIYNKPHTLWYSAAHIRMWITVKSRKSQRSACSLPTVQLGHTYITHVYLLAGEDPPVRISCQENVTAGHILIHCAEYFHVRYQCFDVDNLGELVSAVSPDIIIRFIQ